jgi:predicted permease
VPLPVRRLFRDPLTALVAVASLAVGIGVNTAVFSVADALFLRPLAVFEPARLVLVSARSDAGLPDVLSIPEYEDVARERSTFGGVAAHDDRATTWQVDDRLELLLLSAVSPAYFDVLGVRPEIGRTFDAARDRALPSPPVLLSHSFWSRRLAADPAIVGRPVRLGGRLYTVVGILPPPFTGLQRGVVTDVYIDLEHWSHGYGTRGAFTDRGARHFGVIARLAPGVDHARAEAVASGLGARWRSQFPGTNRERALVAERAASISGQSGRPTGLLLVAIVGLVLVIACANVGMLLVARSEARRREFAVRVAIGAGRGHIIRQVLGEGLVLAGLGTAAGLLLARWLIDIAPALLPPSDVALDFRIGLDARVLVVTLASGLVAALASGLLPALAVLRADVAPALRPTASDTKSRGRLRTALVVVQVALAVAVLDTAGVLVVGFLAVEREWQGFDAHRPLHVLQLSMAGETHSWRPVLETLRARAAALPGVARATYVRRLPMAGYGGGATVSVAVPDGAEAARRRRDVRYNQVGPDYLETLGTRLLRGRFFTPADDSSRTTAVVVSRTFAEHAFGKRDPIGRTIHLDEETRQIVGVVEDVPIVRLHEPRGPFLYLPYNAAPSTDVALIVQPRQASGDLPRQLTRLVAEKGQGAKVLSSLTMNEHMAAQLYPDWLPAMTGASLAGVGILLALAGLFAAVAFVTARRTREFGVRLAVGARPADILRLVLGDGLRLAVAGGALGMLAALAATRVLRGIVYGISDGYGLILSASVVSAVVLGVAASLVPAARAVRTEPSAALRDE